MIKPNKYGKCPIGYIEFNNMCIPRHLVSQYEPPISPNPPNPSPEPPDPSPEPPDPPNPSPDGGEGGIPWREIADVAGATLIGGGILYGLNEKGVADAERVARNAELYETDIEMAARQGEERAALRASLMEEGVLEEEGVVRLGSLEIDAEGNVSDLNVRAEELAAQRMEEARVVEADAQQALREEYEMSWFSDNDPFNLRGNRNIERIRFNLQEELRQQAAEADAQQEADAEARAATDEGKYQWRSTDTKESGRRTKQDVSMEEKELAEEMNITPEEQPVSSNMLTDEEYSSQYYDGAAPTELTPVDESNIEMEVANNPPQDLTPQDIQSIETEINYEGGLKGGSGNSLTTGEGAAQAAIEEEGLLEAGYTAATAVEGGLLTTAGEALTLAAPEMAGALLVGGAMYGLVEGTEYVLDVGQEADKRYVEKRIKEEGTHEMDDRERKYKAKELNQAKKHYQDQVNYHNFGHSKESMEQHAKDKKMLGAINKNIEALKNNVAYGTPIYQIVNDEGKEVMISNKNLGTTQSTDTRLATGADALKKDADRLYENEMAYQEQDKKFQKELAEWKVQQEAESQKFYGDMLRGETETRPKTQAEPVYNAERVAQDHYLNATYDERRQQFIETHPAKTEEIKNDM